MRGWPMLYAVGLCYMLLAYVLRCWPMFYAVGLCYTLLAYVIRCWHIRSAPPYLGRPAHTYFSLEPCNPNALRRSPKMQPRPTRYAHASGYHSCHLSPRLSVEHCTGPDSGLRTPRHKLGVNNYGCSCTRLSRIITWPLHHF